MATTVASKTALPQSSATCTSSPLAAATCAVKFGPRLRSTAISFFAVQPVAAASLNAVVETVLPTTRK
ncbi:MAG: hypothetical protein NTZ98_04585 [Acidobacteria bacterium]|nr:hypothetical protein [Acidobacteriota bacterium]